MYNPKKTKNPLDWVLRYLRESKEELIRVTWPSKALTIKYSVIVVILSIFIAAFFGGLDWVFDQGVKELIKLTV